MLNARTWHRLCVSGYLLFIGTVALWLLPQNSPLAILALAAVGWGILIALMGAVLGVLLLMGRLAMGCPRCGARSQVTGGNRDGMHLDCPSCGDLRIKLGKLWGLKVTNIGSVEDDADGYSYSPDSPLRAPLRHLIPFTIMYLPVILSIIAASVIYKFTFFYLLIPGFWCYAVGGLIVDGLCTGKMRDSSGTATKAKAPFRFWSMILLWLAAYLFAAAFPIGFALQERNRAKGQHPETESLLPATSAESR